MRRTTLQVAASISTISFDALQATNTRPAEGWAQVGEQRPDAGGGGSRPWLAMSCVGALAAGDPARPASRPFVNTKCRDTFSVAVSISTSRSSIMHAE